MWWPPPLVLPLHPLGHKRQAANTGGTWSSLIPCSPIPPPGAQQDSSVLSSYETGRGIFFPWGQYNRNSHFGTRVVVVPGWCWDLGCQTVDFCDLCEARDFCAELAVAPRGRTYSRFRPTTLDRAHHHRVRTFYRVRDALDHHRGGDKSAFSTRCDGGVQHQPSRLPAPRRGSPSGNVGRLDTARPQTSHVALAFCQLSPRSRCCSRSRRASPVLHAHTCAARPPRGSEALFGGAGK